MVLITMGGLPMQYSFLSDLAGFSKISFIFPGVSEKVSFQRNHRLLPQRSGFYHPDLIKASDLVIGKVGYSTLAEVYWAGTPFGFIARPDFRESEALVAFIKAHVNGFPIGEAEFSSGEWVSYLPELLSFSRKKPQASEGAREIAYYLTSLPERTAR
jgi:UDP-N-acetylglucosamine:LPS N-acetylglucosamine transferase